MIIEKNMTEKSFVRKKVKSLTLGEKLRQLREDRHLRVYDLSRKINVRDAYVDALEKGRYDLLPTKVYAKGFVRSYARYFGVSEDVLLGLFEREYSVFHNINTRDNEETVSKLPQVPRFVLTPRIIIVFFGFIALAAIGIYLYLGIDNFVSSPWLIVEEPVHNSVVHGNTVTVRGKTRSNSQVSINGQQVFVDMDGSFTDDVVLSVGTNAIRVNSVNKFNKETSQEIMVEAQYEVERQIVEEKKEKIFIQARDTTVTLVVRADGEEIFNGTIAADEVREFGANEKFFITTDEGKNTYYSTDGETYQPLAEKSGSVTEWEFPRSQEDDVANEAVIDDLENEKETKKSTKNKKS